MLYCSFSIPIFHLLIRLFKYMKLLVKEGLFFLSRFTFEYHLRYMNTRCIIFCWHLFIMKYQQYQGLCRYRHLPTPSHQLSRSSEFSSCNPLFLIIFLMFSYQEFLGLTGLLESTEIFAWVIISPPFFKNNQTISDLFSKFCFFLIHYFLISELISFVVWIFCHSFLNDLSS